MDYPELHKQLYSIPYMAKEIFRLESKINAYKKTCANIASFNNECHSLGLVKNAKITSFLLESFAVNY